MRYTPRVSTKVCRECEQSKPTKEFYSTTTNGKQYFRSYCKLCDNSRRKKLPRVKATPAQTRKWRQRQKGREAKERKESKHDAKHIYWDSRKSDRRHDRKNDLTKGFIAEQIAKGCSYCGEKQLRMTLDRIDNSKGHTKTNVVPACIRCNYARGSMPYEAWRCLSPGLKKARKQGAFGDWTGRLR